MSMPGDYATAFLDALSTEVQRSRTKDMLHIDRENMVLTFRQSPYLEVMPFSVDYGSESPLAIRYQDETYLLQLEEAIGYENVHMLQKTAKELVETLEGIYGSRGSVSVYSWLGSKVLCISTKSKVYSSLPISKGGQSIIPAALIHRFGREKKISQSEGLS